MTHADLDFADSLRKEAGWNQTRRDWERLLDFPDTACCLAEDAGHPVGTVTVTRFGSSLAWIGMLLVRESSRGRGVGKALLEHAISTANTECIGLDATPAGRPLYEKRGFELVTELNRWEGQSSGGKQHNFHGDWSALREVDRASFGCDRSGWLEQLACDSIVSANNDGFGMMRHGARAMYLGPVLASTAAAGAQIVDSLLSQSDGRTVYWDAPEGGFVSPQQWGFTWQRPLYRMLLGKAVRQTFSQMIAIADPATG